MFSNDESTACCWRPTKRIEFVKPETKRRDETMPQGTKSTQDQMSVDKSTPSPKETTKIQLLHVARNQNRNKISKKENDNKKKRGEKLFGKTETIFSIWYSTKWKNWCKLQEGNSRNVQIQITHFVTLFLVRFPLFDCRNGLFFCTFFVWKFEAEWRRWY